MSENYWTSDASGSWGVGANWSNGVPVSTDNVTIDVAGITVSIGADVSNAAALTLNTLNSTLNIDGGSLFTLQNATFDGAFDESAGTYLMGGHGASFNSGMDFSGGTMDALSGAITLNDGGLLAGTLAGSGQLDVSSGTAYVLKGFTATIDSMVIGEFGGKIGFETNVTYGGQFTLLQPGVIGLFGNTLKLNGPTDLQGVVGGGKLVVSHNVTLGNGLASLVLDNGLLLDISGAASQDGNVALGANDSAAEVSIAKTGVWNINADWNIYNPGSVATISNAGLFAKASGAHTSTINASFSSTGTVAADIGTLLLDGPVNSLAGTITGAGTLAVSGVQTTLSGKVALDVATFAQLGGNLVLDHALTYGGTWDLQGGVLDLNGNAVKLTLDGQTNLDGGTLTSFGGTVIINGNAQASNVLIGGPTTIDINGTLDQTANIGFGQSSNTIANIAAGGSWIIEGDSAILGSFGQINNSGTFVDPNGSGDAVVQATFISSATVTVNNSTLTLAGSNLLGGTLSGTGLLDMAGFTVLNAGVDITVGALAVDNNVTVLQANLSYANNFLENGAFAVVDLGGNSLSLTGSVSLDGGLVTDGGTLVAAGATTIGNYAIGGGATLIVSGTADQIGNLEMDPLSGPGSLSIAASASYTLDDDLNIYGPGNLVNSGTFTASGTGTSFLDVAVTNKGVLQVNDQTLQLGDGGTLGGTITGAGTLQLDNFAGSGLYNLGSGLAISCGGLQVSNNITAALSGNFSYGGEFDLNFGILQMNSDTLTLAGSSVLAGVMTGSGTLLDSGAGTITNFSVLQGGLLSITGASEQIGNLTVGDQAGLVEPPSTAELFVAAGATYTLGANDSIFANGTLAVAGTLVAAGDGVGTITTTVVDTGVIAANLGTLDSIGAVGGSGIFSIGIGGSLEFAATATFAAGSGDVSFTAGGGALILEDPGTYLGTLENFSTGDTIAMAGFQGPITGTYANAGDTQITFSDGKGDSATLTFSTAQTLSNFHYGTGPQGLESVFHY